MILNIKPVLKWAGGKTQLLDEITPLIKKKLKKNGTYFEPFLGGGAVLFSLKPKKAVVNDFNKELYNLYTVIKNSPKELIMSLRKHENNEDYFYNIRNIDRLANYTNLSSIEKASRTIYLNKTCFNGLYRVNSKGEFNVPFANNKNPKIVDEKNIIGISRYFRNNDVTLLNRDFEDAIQFAKKGDFIYFDPPYVPTSKTASFTAYTKESFDMEDQIRLRDLAIKLDEKDIDFLISNSIADEILELYGNKDIFQIREVSVKRNINSKGHLRNGVKEALISRVK